MKRSALFLCYLFLSSVAHAGAWTQNEDSLYVAANLFRFASDGFFDAQGNEQSQAAFNKYELNLYAEYGLTDHWTVGANLFVNQVSQNQSNGTSSIAAENLSTGDSEIFARRELYRDNRYVLSVQPLIKLPSYNQRDTLPRGGGEQMDAELSLLGGMNFEWMDQQHYVDARIGYRHRDDSALNAQYRADIRAGLRVNALTTVIPALYIIRAESIPSVSTFSQSGQNDFDSVKAEITISYDIPDEPYSIIAGIYRHIDGRNSGNGTGVFTGATWQLP